MSHDEVPDPRRDGQVPWTLYAQGAGFAAVAIAGCWAATRAAGLLALVCWVVGVAAGLWAAYLLLLSAGWQLLSTALGRWTARARRARALRTGERLLELRFEIDVDDPVGPLRGLHRVLDERLGPDAECDGIGSMGEAATCWLRGTDPARMVAAVRRAVEDLPLPEDAYLWVPDLARPGRGRVLPLLDSAA